MVVLMRSLLCLFFLLLPGMGLAAIFTVTSTADSGAGSLRQAILDANANSGADSIVFNLPGPGPFTLRPGAGGLPGVLDALTIDATTQPGYAGIPLIELTGALSGEGSHGFRLLSGNCTVRGFAINRFIGYGISIEGGVSNIIQANFIGTGRNGSTNMGNVTGGILVYRSSDNLIGGLHPSNRNLVSGTNKHGILIMDAVSTNNSIQGNLIGTDLTGTVRRGNAQNGVLIVDSRNNLVGGTTPEARNIISGNGQSGVYVLGSSSGNVFRGNYIGTDISGTVSVSNAVDGITLYGAVSNVIGGAAVGAGNLVSGNFERGILITANGKQNVIQGNLIGSRAGGSLALGNGFAGISAVNGSSNSIGPANVISGNKQSGVTLGANSAGNVIHGNLIGLDITGTNAMTNLFYGISIGNSFNNIIGGTNAGNGNVISGNLLAGVFIAGTNAPGNQVQGNFIGTSISGQQAIANAAGGVRIEASGNIIGGSLPEAKNVISGNAAHGIYLYSNRATSNSVRGNFIGTDLYGTAPLPNASAGVGIVDAAFNFIGGTNAHDRNIISGNTGTGIFLSGNDSTENRLQGNYIGSDYSGGRAIPNLGGGVYLYGSPHNFIGGIAPGAGNLISGNRKVGVSIGDPGANGNLVRGNLIGTQADGVSPLGNQWHGIEILNSSSNNIIGGTVAAAGNRIAYAQTSLYAGVRVRDGCNGNQIRRNGIFSNALLGIDHGANGVSPNDAGDIDAGANELQNFPIITSAEGRYACFIQGTLNSKPNMTFSVDFYASSNQDATTHGEGEAWIGQTTVTTAANGNGSFALTITNRAGIPVYVAAIATDPVGNSSEFSKCKVAVAGTMDSDGDAMPNEYETAQGFDPFNTADGAFDADGDGVSNQNEYRAGTDPLDILDYLRIEQFQYATNVVTFSFPSVAQKSYSIDVSTNLLEGWTTLSGANNLPGTGFSIQITNTNPGALAKFYRVRIP